jgi:hypothetical protein
VLTYAATLHDVGKLGVPTRLLRKTDRLDDHEFEEIRLHPSRGVEVVRDIAFLDEAYSAILHHHERMDGLGYPSGLRGMRIPPFARIIAVADAFDSMTSTRSYRGARGSDEALTELRANMGTQFAPEIVDAIAAALARAELAGNPWRGDGTVYESSGGGRAQLADLPPGAVVAEFDHDDPAYQPIVVAEAESREKPTGDDLGTGGALGVENLGDDGLDGPDGGTGEGDEGSESTRESAASAGDGAGEGASAGTESGDGAYARADSGGGANPGDGSDDRAYAGADSGDAASTKADLGDAAYAAGADSGDDVAYAGFEADDDDDFDYGDDDGGSGCEQEPSGCEEAPVRADASGCESEPKASGCESEPKPSGRLAPSAGLGLGSGPGRLSQQPMVPPQSRLPRSPSSPDQAAVARDGLRLAPFGSGFTVPTQAKRNPEPDLDGARPRDPDRHTDRDAAVETGAPAPSAAPAPPSADPETEG